MPEQIAHRICLDCWAARYGHDDPPPLGALTPDSWCCWCGTRPGTALVLWEPREHGEKGCSGVGIELDPAPVDRADLD